jgi:hypothetical protein
VTRALQLSSLLSTLAASATLAGCGEGAMRATKGTLEPAGQRQSAAKSLTPEEMREYDANEGRCGDDGGKVRNVGTVDAYCAFPVRSNDFHLVESSQLKKPGGEEE